MKQNINCENYKNIEEYNLYKEHKISIVFDDMIELFINYLLMVKS